MEHLLAAKNPMEKSMFSYVFRFQLFQSSMRSFESQGKNANITLSKIYHLAFETVLKCHINTKHKYILSLTRPQNICQIKTSTLKLSCIQDQVINTEGGSKKYRKVKHPE